MGANINIQDFPKCLETHPLSFYIITKNIRREILDMSTDTVSRNKNGNAPNNIEIYAKLCFD